MATQSTLAFRPSRSIPLIAKQRILNQNQNRIADLRTSSSTALSAMYPSEVMDRYYLLNMINV